MIIYLVFSLFILFLMFFFFKQKTAYEMRISDWSSDVCSSDLIAPTGTIGLVMDCDTTGIEPDFALVKFKKLAGGGYFKIINQSLPPALATLDRKSVV